MRDYIIKVTFEEDAFGNSIQDNCRQGCSWKGGDQEEAVIRMQM